MARPTALAPLGAVLRGIGATLENIGAGMAADDTSTARNVSGPPFSAQAERPPPKLNPGGFSLSHTSISSPVAPCAHSVVESHHLDSRS